MMMLDDAIEIVQKAREGSYYIDCVIAEALGRNVFPFSTSIDEALTLLPEGYAIREFSIWPGSASRLIVYGTVMRGGQNVHKAADGRWEATGASPALAICTGALLAHRERM